MTILRKLDQFWRKANPSERMKINVYDAVIRAKLLYGLESAPMPESVKHKLDVFQLKGLRKILNIKTTFVDRSYPNKAVIQTAQSKMNEGAAANKPQRCVKTYSQVYEERKIKLLQKIIQSEEDDPLRSVTFKPNSMTPIDITDRPGTKRRIGQPKTKWLETGLEALWRTVGRTIDPTMKYTTLDLNNENHIETMKKAAKTNRNGDPCQPE